MYKGRFTCAINKWHEGNMGVTPHKIKDNGDVFFEFDLSNVISDGSLNFKPNPYFHIDLGEHIMIYHHQLLIIDYCTNYA